MRLNLHLHLLVYILFVGITAFAQKVQPHFTHEVFNQLEFAHRGGYANGPENTLQTILKNINNGVKAVEVDVQMTRDSQLVLFHDKTINRVLASDKETFVTDLSLAELKAIPLRDASQGIQFICTLSELVDTLAVLIPKLGKKDFILELDFKPSGEQTVPAIMELCSMIITNKKSVGENLYNYFYVSTFYPNVLKELAKADAKIVTGYALHNSPEDKKLVAKISIWLASCFMRKNNATVLDANICMINQRFVKKWTKKGILINAYSANTQCEKEYISGFDIAYTTDCPAGCCSSDTYGKPKKWCKSCK